MEIGTTTKLLIAGTLIVAGIFVTQMIGNARVRNLERDIETARAVAKQKETAAREGEIRAAGYERKIEYLEAEIARIGQIARRQDEELERMEGNIGNARADVERARSIRASRATADELCERLGALGHPCE
jgi:uncharacterized membrane protein YqiK